jgi:hypothetical protein
LKSLDGSNRFQLLRVPCQQLEELRSSLTFMMLSDNFSISPHSTRGVRYDEKLFID